MELPELAEYLNNKRVIIVGRSPYLLNDPEYKNQGEFIDSFDVIVRVNSPIPHQRGKTIRSHRIIEKNEPFINTKQQECLGKRTNLFYICHSHTIINPEYNSYQLESFQRDGGFFICCPWDWMGVYTEPWKDYLKTIKEQISFYKTSYSFYLYTKQRYNINYSGKIEPYTGELAIADLLRYNIKELRLIGFTCYHLPQEIPYREDRSESGHNIKVGLIWLQDLIKSDKRITIGTMLKDVLDNRYVPSEKWVYRL